MINSKLNNFYYAGVEIDYHSGRHGCNCDGMCRCSTIEGAHVKEVSIKSVVEHIKKENKIKCSELEDYCMDRLARAYKMYNPDTWEVEVCTGYYGEEIKAVTFNNYSDLCKALNEMLEIKSAKNKIEYILKKEYGYLLESLKKAKYLIETIPTDSILLKSNTEYVKKVSPEDFYSDTEYKLIRGIVRPEDGVKGKYRLIDGFHRVITTKKKEIKVLVARVSQPGKI